MMEKRLDYLDMVKGIGIVLVVLGHVPNVSEGMLKWLLSFHMPLFFVVSGILFAYRQFEQGPFLPYLKNRFFRTMVPYAWFSLINLSIDWLRSVRNPEAVSREMLSTSVLQTVSFFGVSVLWFLPTIFLGELCLYGLVRKCPVWLRCAVVAAGAVLTPVGVSLVSSGIPMEEFGFLAWLGNFLLALLRVFPALAFLLMGHAAYGLLEKPGRKAAWELLIGAGCLGLNVAAAILNERVDLHYLVLHNVIYYYLGAGGAAFGLILICRHVKPFWLPVFLGQNSLIIMLTHLDCRVMRLAIMIAAAAQQAGGEILSRVSLYLSLLIGELVMIALINRFGFFLIGRKEAVKMEGPRKKIPEQMF